MAAYVDGVAVATTTDTDFTNSGIAVGTERASALFDDVRVTTP